MKKRDKKLQLHRETIHRLQPSDLVKAEGGAAQAGIDATGFWTSCIEPNCCGETLATQ